MMVPYSARVEVFPGKDEAEVIVRWRHPGNGGFLTVEKYRYSANGLALMERSEFMTVDGEKKWISESTLKQREVEMEKKFPAVRSVIRQ